MSLARELSTATGTYFGTGDGPESGPFVSRIAVASLPNGGVSIDYEATSRELGVQHREHSLLVAGRFAQPEPAGPYVIEIVIEIPELDRLTYAWWWAEAGGIPIEQSTADARRVIP